MRQPQLGYGLVLILTSIASLTAQTRGVIVDNGTKKVIVFNADTDAVIGSVTLPFRPSSMGDCTVTQDQTQAFVTDFLSHVWAINLSPPSLTGAPNPIPISNVGEDTSLSPNGKHVVACDGGAAQPVSVIDVASRTQIGTLFTGSGDCNSVDVAKSGSVLVTSSTSANVRRLTIDGAGTLTNTGEVLAAGGEPNNVVAAPNSASGVVINRDAENIRSFTVPGLSAVDTRTISGFGISGVFNLAGDQLFVRDNSAKVSVFSYNPATAAIGSTPLFIIPIAPTPTFFGMDQMAIHPNSNKLYVSQPGSVQVFNATTGALITTMTSPDISSPTGICLAACTPPVINNATVSQATLWPPTQKMVKITVGYDHPGNCPSTCTLSVSSNEPVDGPGDGHAAPDWVVVDSTHVQLRAERSGTGNGRIYTITITCTNTAGQSSTATTTVRVPRNQVQ
ncbi:MAG: hypothetical protein AUH28_17030 [Acidobacteria bacterium 13_1_40CM_56_16]|nr:MAG: hypothetical protein AUH28_17030 [Acidobacteria bacterium 13_1_40CM_56_16]